MPGSAESLHIQQLVELALLLCLLRLQRLAHGLVLEPIGLDLA